MEGYHRKKRRTEVILIQEITTYMYRNFWKFFCTSRYNSIYRWKSNKYVVQRMSDLKSTIQFDIISRKKKRINIYLDHNCRSGNDNYQLPITQRKNK